MRFAIAVVVWLACALSARSVEACSCLSSGPPCQGYFQVDAVFVGTVRGIEPLEPTRDNLFESRAVTFALERVFRGVQGTTAVARTGKGGGDCGYPFEIGQRYLVYAHRGQDGRTLSASICSRTRPVSEAAEDLAYLERLPATGTGARVFGQIKHWEPDLATGESRQFGGVAAVTVIARGDTTTRSAETDDTGRYEIAGLPPGSYDIEALPPPRFVSEYLRDRIELRDARACAAVDFGLHYDGRINGSVLHADGRPAAGIMVQVVAAERASPTWDLRARAVETGAGGYFEFSGVPPGVYLLGVSLVTAFEPKVVYPTTFYPGTRNEREATPIAVGEGTQVTLNPFVIPAAREPVQITGTVTWPDGTPAVGAFVFLDDGAAARRSVAAAVKVGADGRFSFLAFDGLRYRARAFYDVPGDPRAQGRVGPFIASSNLAPLRIVLRPAADR